LFFSFTKSESKKWNIFFQEAGRGREEVAQVMYTHVNKCKKHTRKENNKKTSFGLRYIPNPREL
jgi:hypothetical protein